jgi:hypothetical protein
VIGAETREVEPLGDEPFGRLTGGDARRLRNELGEGKLIGEMSFVTDEKPNADVVALEPTRFSTWCEAKLRSALQGSTARMSRSSFE